MDMLSSRDCCRGLVTSGRVTGVCHLRQYRKSYLYNTAHNMGILYLFQERYLWSVNAADVRVSLRDRSMHIHKCTK